MARSTRDPVVGGALARVHTIALVCLCAIVGGEAQPYPQIPTITTAASGYNAIKGTPGFDTSGASGALIFDVATFDDPEFFRQGNTDYILPNGFSASSSDYCTWQSDTTTVVTSKQELQTKLLAISAEASTAVYKAAFTMSNLFTESFTSITTSVNALYSAECRTFTITISPRLAVLHPHLVNAITYLDTSSDEDMFEFVETYGTHIPIQSVMGGRSFVGYSLNSSVLDYWSKDQIQTAAKLTYQTKKLKMGLAFTDQKEMVKRFGQYTTATHESGGSLPCDPPESEDGIDEPSLHEWRSMLLLSGPNPATMLYPKVLRPITTLFSEDFFPSNKFAGLNIADKERDLSVFLSNRYCAMLNAHGGRPGSSCSQLDPLSGLLAYFNTSCPAGWITHDRSQGRLLVAVANGGQAIFNVGAKMHDLADRPHHHTVDGTMKTQAIKGLVCPGNNYEIYDRKDVSFHLNGPVHDSSTAGLPFSHLRMCEFIGANATDLIDLQLPYQTLVHFESNECPPGWSPLRDEWAQRSIVPADGRTANPYPIATKDRLQLPGMPLAHNHSLRLNITNSKVTMMDGSQVCDFGVDPRTYSDTFYAQGEWNVSHAAALACSVDDPLSQTTLNAPPGMLIFSSGTQCPHGWRVPVWFDGLFGRYIVNPIADEVIGRAYPPTALSIPPGADSYENQHMHDVEPSGRILNLHNCMRSTYLTSQPDRDYWSCSDPTWYMDNFNHTHGQVPFVQMVICEQDLA